jgi:hypothetical protein
MFSLLPLRLCGESLLVFSVTVRLFFFGSGAYGSTQSHETEKDEKN